MAANKSPLSLRGWPYSPFNGAERHRDHGAGKNKPSRRPPSFCVSDGYRDGQNKFHMVGRPKNRKVRRGEIAEKVAKKAD
jgi:hypothetical protein